MNSKKVILILFVLLCLFIARAEAAEADLPVQHEPQDVVSAPPLDDFSSQAQGWTTDTADRDFLDIQGGGSLYDALNKYPGIQARGEESGNAPSVRIRGSGSTSRTLLLFDGVPINTQDGLGANPLLVPLEFAQNIEIIKGPSSLFYGSDAVGGAINLVPQRLDQTKIQAGYESTHHASLWLASPLLNSKDNFLQTSVYIDHNQDNFKYNDPNAGSGVRDNNQTGTQRYILTGENKFLGAKISHQFIYAQEIGQNPGPTTFPGSTLDLNRKGYLLGFDVSHALNNYMDVLYKFSWVETRSQDTQNAVTTDTESYKNIQTVTVTTRLTANNQVDLFTDFYIDHFKTNYAGDYHKMDRYFEHGFIWRGQPEQNLFILAGARYLPDQNEFLKNIMLKQIYANYNVWASYSEGIRLPNFTQLYSSNSFYVGNPNLHAETSNQIEVGIEKPMPDKRYSLLDHLRLKASLYSIDYSNFIQYQNTPAPFSYKNVDGVTSQGGEATAAFDYEIYHGQASYSLLSVKDKTIKQVLPLSPTSQAYLLLGAQLSVFVFEMQNNFWSTYGLDDQIHSQSAWDTTDFSIRTNGLAHWNIRTGIQNIFNKSRVFSLGYPEPGRKYFAFVERDF